jgi:hypothetical protein
LTTFKIINNPLRMLKRNEVWVKGTFPVQNAQGYLEDREQAKLAKTFRTLEQAEGFIAYQTQVREFRGEA